MLKPLLLSPAILLLAFLPAANSQKPTHKTAAAEPATITVEPPRPAVKQIYKVDCAICHGDTGDGKTDLSKSMNLTIPDWTSPATLTAKSDQQLYDMIRKGNDKMPPEDSSRAKDDEIKGLVKYIRSFASQAPATAAPAAEPAAAPATAPAPATTPSTSPSTI
ncbi:MAG TPA: cytochrome c [Terracidiphilus sp.]|jgi:mono/diheme cytochrome c family protein|nr:cytochrome c [Terracidiphilus sp.]